MRKKTGKKPKSTIATADGLGGGDPKYNTSELFFHFKGQVGQNRTEN